MNIVGLDNLIQANQAWVCIMFLYMACGLWCYCRSWPKNWRGL